MPILACGSQCQLDLSLVGADNGNTVPRWQPPRPPKKKIFNFFFFTTRGWFFIQAVQDFHQPTAGHRPSFMSVNHSLPAELPPSPLQLSIDQNETISTSGEYGYSRLCRPFITVNPNHFFFSKKTPPIPPNRPPGGGEKSRPKKKFSPPPQPP